MRLLISSLQVSRGASKGHLHPAIELGLEMRQRGHKVAILPVPSPLGCADKKQIEHCEFEIIEPPALPPGLPYPPEVLARLAKDPLTTAQAYESFLVSPLQHQFTGILQKISDYQPDIVVYDLLVYAVPLAARLLGIPDVGYCAGLKLIAPPALTSIYQSVREKLAPLIDDFLGSYSLNAKFHHLELLSATYQLVFVPQQFIHKKLMQYPANTICAGSLPLSKKRYEKIKTDFLLPDNDRPKVVLCFGSVLDPANYPDLTNQIIQVAQKLNCYLMISSQKPDFFPRSESIHVANYLPLLQLLKNASLFIHHGGANTFSEALTIGVPQIIIPLTNDQPIQAECLTQAQAGISIYPNEVTEEKMLNAFQQLLDASNPIHHRIKEVKNLFSASEGARVAINILEEMSVVKR